MPTMALRRATRSSGEFTGPEPAMPYFVLCSHDEFRAIAYYKSVPQDLAPCNRPSRASGGTLYGVPSLESG
jgi:hypothetical protein